MNVRRVRDDGRVLGFINKFARGFNDHLTNGRSLGADEKGEVGLLRTAQSFSRASSEGEDSKGQKRDPEWMSECVAQRQIEERFLTVGQPQDATVGHAIEYTPSQKKSDYTKHKHNDRVKDYLRMIRPRV